MRPKAYQVIFHSAYLRFSTSIACIVQHFTRLFRLSNLCVNAPQSVQDVGTVIAQLSAFQGIFDIGGFDFSGKERVPGYVVQILSLGFSFVENVLRKSMRLAIVCTGRCVINQNAHRSGIVGNTLQPRGSQSVGFFGSPERPQVERLVIEHPL